MFEVRDKWGNSRPMNQAEYLIAFFLLNVKTFGFGVGGANLFCFPTSVVRAEGTLWREQNLHDLWMLEFCIITLPPGNCSAPTWTSPPLAPTALEAPGSSCSVPCVFSKDMAISFQISPAYAVFNKCTYSLESHCTQLSIERGQSEEEWEQFKDV